VWSHSTYELQFLQFFTVISRVATILKTRYTSPGFWSAGLGLFLEAEQLVSESSEKQHLHTCIARAREQLSEIENQPEESTQNRRNQGPSSSYREKRYVLNILFVSPF
jgi:E3 ubiquitin-protein ligase AIP2